MRIVNCEVARKVNPVGFTVDHVDAVLKLMSVLTGDDQFEKSIPEVHKIKGGVSMESIFDIKINRAVDEKTKDIAERMIKDGALPDEKIAQYAGRVCAERCAV